jgi:hypothetical protein
MTWPQLSPLSRSTRSGRSGAELPDTQPYPIYSAVKNSNILVSFESDAEINNERSSYVEGNSERE